MRALLATDELVTVISADAREYKTILSALELSGIIDLSEPVCVLFVSMLHFLADADADALVAAIRERMAPGITWCSLPGASTTAISRRGRASSPPTVPAPY